LADISDQSVDQRLVVRFTHHPDGRFGARDPTAIELVSHTIGAIGYHAQALNRKFAVQRPLVAGLAVVDWLGAPACSGEIGGR